MKLTRKTAENIIQHSKYKNHMAAVTAAAATTRSIVKISLYAYNNSRNTTCSIYLFSTKKSVATSVWIYLPYKITQARKAPSLNKKFPNMT